MSQSSLARTPDGFVKDESRRSTRIDRSVPLIVFGQNSSGQPFVERTVSTSVSLHGCRYPSRHDCGVETWVTLQVVGLSVEPKPPAVRARVRSLHPSHSARELQQVGVELENPANVWGIITPPQDWLNSAKASTATASYAAAAPSPATREINKDAGEGKAPAAKPEHKLAEVATFPSPSPVAPKPQAPMPAEAPKPRRLVITPDGLIGVLQGKLQQAAEKAVQAAVAKQLDEAVRNAVASIDEFRQSSIRDLKRELERCQEFVAKMNGDLEPRTQARLNEAVAHAASEFDGAAARAIERRYERFLENMQSALQEALLKLDARSAEAQALVQGSVNSTLASIERQAAAQLNGILSETKDRAASALSSLDAENREACEARRKALEAEVARAAERSTDQFRKGMKAFLYSCLVAAVSAVDEHSKATLDSLTKDNGKTLREGPERGNGSADPDDPEILPAPDNDPFTH
ncbi:MAG TPA: hypothetical protein VHM93_11385 [Candidatus Acidoferrum sp.]|nr:hypothetical protein [Candidatus Acidoferrum sp.]